MGKGIVTINTDAGFYPIQKVGSYAYWIKSDGLFLSGSGVFKHKCRNPTDAEFKAVINALHILKASGVEKIYRIIFNRDNIYVSNCKGGNPMEKMLHDVLKELFKKYYPQAAKNPGMFSKFYSFRHVKAHSAGKDKRSYVNNWCDEQCKMELRKWKAKNSPAPAADAAAKS